MTASDPGVSTAGGAPVVPAEATAGGPAPSGDAGHARATRAGGPDAGDVSAGVSWAPDPGAASPFAMLRAQAGLELRLNLRNGENLLLTLVIPLVLLVFFSSVDVLPASAGRAVDFVTPGVLALAVLSTSFTGQAIATGFERSYGALRRLGVTPLPRGLLLAGKSLAVVAVEVLQVAVICVVGLALGWHPHGNPLAVAVVLLVGSVAFSAMGLLMAGTLRAEATLAAANGLYLVLLLLGGIVVPLSSLPGGLHALGSALPSAALADGVRSVLSGAAGFPVADVLILVGWAVVTGAWAARVFRWE